MQDVEQSKLYNLCIKLIIEDCTTYIVRGWDANIINLIQLTYFGVFLRDCRFLISPFLKYQNELVLKPGFFSG
jgi:hypothetical protein